MDKFKNKYRIPSARLQNWDYRWIGSYFITLCTANREHFLGEIANGKMELSHIGIIADIFWYEIKNHAKNIELGEFVVMPNHIHGILKLNNDNTNVNTNVETGHALSLQNQQNQQNQQQTSQQLSPQTIGQQRFQNIGKNSVSSIIGSYKSAVTKHAHRLGFYFNWQSRFYDHIIRNEKSFNKISEYIINNPLNWENDKFYK